MILAALLAAASPTGIADVERAFAARAQTEGQWTAFRATAADEAVLFVPEETNAQAWLKGRADPAIGFMWWPAAAYSSCDGKAAVSTGSSVRGAYRGYFTTVWVRQPDGGWKWVLDHGNARMTPRPVGERVTEKRAACPSTPLPVAVYARPSGARHFGVGHSPDRTLSWDWVVDADGNRTFTVHQYDGSRMRQVLQDVVRAQ